MGAEAEGERIMTTIVRAQMAASTGALAAERERLEREIEALSTGLPPGAAEVVRQADELMAEHGRRLSELKAKRDAIDAKFSVSVREAAEARERAAEEARAQLVQQLTDAAERMFEAFDAAERQLRTFVHEANAAIGAHTEVRRAAQALTLGAKVPMALDSGDLVRRLGDRIAGLLRQIHVPGALGTSRLGALQLPAEIASVRTPPEGSPPAAAAWREREEAALGPAIEQIIRHGGR